MYIEALSLPGTFPVVSLLVRYSINNVLIGKGLEYCSSVNNRLTVVMFDDANITCNDVKVEIAVSLAFTSGLFMVCTRYQAYNMLLFTDY